MTENEIPAIIVDVAYRIHKRLGPGLLESVYEAIMAYEIRKRGLHVSQQQVQSFMKRFAWTLVSEQIS